MSTDKKPEDQVTEAGAITGVPMQSPDPVLGATNPPDPVRTVKLRGY